MDIKYIINGHNSFYLRDGWINKGYRLIKNVLSNNALDNESLKTIPSSLFSKNENDSIDYLGMGSMMVLSLKFWLQLIGLLEKSSNNKYSINDEISLILEKDPYLRETDTLWLLHYNILNNKAEVPFLWETVFKATELNYFTRQELESIIRQAAREKSITLSESSLKDSVSVFLKTYLYSKEKIENPEENLFSPFSRLKYLELNGENYSFRNISNKEISEYIMYYFIADILKESKNLQISMQLAYSHINKIIKMTYLDFSILISKLELQKEIKVDRAAGLDNISLTKDLKDINKMEIISKYILGSESYL